MTTASVRPSPHWTLALAGTAAAYALVGWAAMWLSISPGYAAPLFPSAGLALVCALMFGWPMLLGVYAASLPINILARQHEPFLLDTSILLPALIAAGATLQAAVGAALVRRFVSQPLRLSEPRDIAAFFLAGGACACVIGCTTATISLWLLGGL